MDEKQKELKEFLEKQIEWTKEKDGILGKIDEIFHQMKIIAKYKAEHNLLDEIRIKLDMNEFEVD